jgi:hypothetical protein
MAWLGLTLHNGAAILVNTDTISRVEPGPVNKGSRLMTTSPDKEGNVVIAVTEGPETIRKRLEAMGEKFG